MQSLVAPVLQVPAEQAILDGEVVVLDKDGVSNFQALQNAFSGQSTRPLTYFVFDLLYLDGYDLRRVPLEQRKATLEQRLAEMPKATRQRIRYSDHIVGSGAAFFREACGSGLEGNHFQAA